jgi:hypothetical protein
LRDRCGWKDSTLKGEAETERWQGNKESWIRAKFIASVGATARARARGKSRARSRIRRKVGKRARVRDWQTATRKSIKQMRQEKPELSFRACEAAARKCGESMIARWMKSR